MAPTPTYGSGHAGATAGSTYRTNLPAPQALQLDWDASSWYRPEPQTKHAKSTPGPSENLPAGHGVQVVTLLLSSAV